MIEFAAALWNHRRLLLSHTVNMLALAGLTILIQAISTRAIELLGLPKL